MRKKSVNKQKILNRCTLYFVHLFNRFQHIPDKERPTYNSDIWPLYAVNTIALFRHHEGTTNSNKYTVHIYSIRVKDKSQLMVRFLIQETEENWLAS